MRDFEVEGRHASRFVEDVRRLLAQHGYTDIVSLEVEADRLLVIFSKMGVTQLQYRLEEGDSGFLARLEGQRVAPFHTPFVAVFQEQFEQVIQKAGGRLI
jgi:hypothetical protein